MIQDARHVPLDEFEQDMLGRLLAAQSERSHLLNLDSATLLAPVPARRRRVPRARVAALASVGVLAACGVAVAAGLDPWSLLPNSSPTQLFKANPAWWNQDNTPNYNTPVIRSSVVELETIKVPHVGEFEYWGARTTSGGYCEAFKGPDGRWAGAGDDPEKNYNFGGTVPGCGVTSTYPKGSKFSWSTDWIGPTDPCHCQSTTSVQAHEISIVVFGTVAYPGAATVLNPTTGVTAPVVNGSYFVLVLPPGSTSGNDVDLEALDTNGSIVGQTQYANP